MKAIIIGATGATGKDLVNQLITNENFSEILVFVRREFPIKHPKITQYIVDFNHLEQSRNFIKGDVLFSCLGTTLKQAGSKENQWKIEHDYQYNFAKIAQENGVPQLVLVSSVGANKNSFIFYSKMKGKTEESVKSLNFKRLVVFRPPSLIRKNSDRAGENFGVKMISFLNNLGILKSWKPMHTEFLALKMIKASLQTENGIFTLESSTIFEF